MNAQQDWCNQHVADIRAATTGYLEAWPNVELRAEVVNAFPDDLHALVAGRLLANVVIIMAISDHIEAPVLWSHLVTAGVLGHLR
jgi:hypothetical protein